LTDDHAQDEGVAGGTQLKGDLVLTGASTMAPLMSAIGKRFSERYPGVKFDIRTGGSGQGISDARSGVAQIGMASRALNDKENDLIGLPIARDGVCLLVHKDNPITALKDDLIVAIFRGQITNWKSVGGQDAPIHVINRNLGRSEVEIMYDFFKLKYQEIQAKTLAGDNIVAIEAVAGDPHAIT